MLTMLGIMSLLLYLDFQDSPHDEEDTRSSQEYINDLEMEFQERALLAKSKRFFKKGTQRFSGAKATDQTECHKCGLLAEAYEWDEDEVSSDDNEMVEVKVLMALTDDESGVVGKESARFGEWVKISMRKCIGEHIPNQNRKILGVDKLIEDTSSCGQKDLIFVKSSAEDINVSKVNVERPWLSETKEFNFPNHDTGRIISSESHVNVIDSSVTVNATDSSITDFVSAKESTSVCSTPLPSLKKLHGVEPQTEL
ncbi:hypothetical protein Tco_0969422 [Tanacetum coccineum]